MRQRLIAALKVLSKRTQEIHNNELKTAIHDWVKKWRPAKLLKLHKESPEVFKDLPKGPNKPLYRYIGMTPAQLDKMIDGKSFKCKRDLESWSTSEDIRSDFVEAGKKHIVTFKKTIKPQDRLVHIPEVELGFKDSDFSNEGEVITVCQSVSEDDVVKILPA